jgi:poly(A) polymerase
LETLICNHLRPSQLERTPTLTNRAIFRFLRDTDEVGVDVVLLSLADLLGKQTPPMEQRQLSNRVEIARQLFTAMFEAPPGKYDPEPYFKGNEISEALGIEPGPEIGWLLKTLREAQVTGEVKSKADAMAFIRLMHQGGLRMDDIDDS